MKLFYHLGIFLYAFFIRIAAIFNTKAKQFVRGRKNWENKLRERINKNAEYLWFHCASLGEFEQGRPLIEAINKQFPDYKILLTFFSPSGYEIRKNYSGADVICYLPIDSAKNARKFIDIVQPKKVFFVKYEYWYHYFTEIKKQQIPLFMVSAIFRENQQFFKSNSWGKWYRKLFANVDFFFVQNETSAKLLENIGIQNYVIAGDTRFDRVAEIANGAKQIQIVEKFKANQPLVVAGSTWKPDEDLLVEFINKHEQVKFMIAPHEVSTNNINRIQQLLKNKAILFSKADENTICDFQVLIIDSIGILSSLYQYGTLAYIGGGFGVGIHNILEAATFGLPVVFGPNHQKFQEAVDLIQHGGAFPISNQNELNSSFSALLNDKNRLENARNICKNYIEKNTGSTPIIIKKVFNI